jgi:hypothetical protein
LEWAKFGSRAHLLRDIKGILNTETALNLLLIIADGTLARNDLGTAERNMENLIEIVNEQANDDALWFVAATASEAYLQQELRRLHTAIEDLK